MPEGPNQRYTNGEWTCVQPNVKFFIGEGIRTVYTVRIMNSPLRDY